MPDARSKIVGIERNLAGIRPQRIGQQPFFGEGLQVVSGAKTDGEMAGGADCILQKPGVFVGVGMARLIPKILNVIFWHIVRIGAQRRQQQARLLRFEGERVHFNQIENVLPAGLRREIVINPAEQSVAADLPGIAFAFEADSFGDLQPVLASLPRQNVGTSKAVNDASHLGQRVGGVGTRLLQIVRELGAQMADQPPGKCAVQRNRTVSVATCCSPFSLMALVVSGLDGSRNTLFSPE